jgi:uncharacterized protein YjbJ (UPF0337 family)
MSLEESAASITEPTPLEEIMDSHEVSGAAREVAGKVEKNYGRLKDKVTDAAQDVADQQGTGLNEEQVRGKVREVSGRAEQAYGSVKAKVSEVARDLSDRYGDAAGAASNSWNRTLDLVQENPGTAIGISVLVGAGLGAVIAYLAKED